MADFKTHISTSTVLGIAYGGLMHVGLNVPIEHCLVSAGLCSVAGMLPDLDSDSGIPFRETLCFMSVMVPMLLVRRFQSLNMSPETMVLAAGVLYVAIRFGVGQLFKRYTVHRGMWHSVPAALIAGGITFLVCLSPDIGVRLIKSWAVVLGFVSHLILDELYSVDINGKGIRIKKSFGTALKLFGKKWWPNVSAYGKLILVGVLIAMDPSVQSCLQDDEFHIPIIARDWDDVHTHDPPDKTIRR